MLRINKCGLLTIVILYLATRGVLSIRNAYMEIPEAVERGRTVVIKCIYVLESEDLYQVKWYKEEHEFCRYSPRDVPPLKVFPIHGIEVVREESDAMKLTIKKAMSGEYMCEISADAPSFFTVDVKGSLQIVDLPKSDPHLNGLKRSYHPGMKLKAECISHDSMPAANLTFFINNERALSRHVWHRVSGRENSSLWTAYSTIQFVLQKHHFVRGKIKVLCSASIYEIYFRSHEWVAVEDRRHTTISPLPETREAIVYPINRISDNNESGNRGMSCSTEYREVGIFMILAYAFK